MANETVTHDERLRDLESEAFRTGRTLAEHSEQLATIRNQQRTAFGNIDSLDDAIETPGNLSTTQRLNTITDRLDTLERVLFALARAQDINPEATG